MSAGGFDREAALRRLGGREKTLDSLIELFVEECPKLLERMRTAIAAKDHERLARAAHTLKGSASIFGCEQLVTASLALEQIAKREELDSAPDAYRSVIERAEQVLGEIR